MVSLMQEDKIRAIGVSNFSIRHLEHLKKHSKTKPAVNQIEIHPFLIQSELREYCAKEGIQVMAYCSLGSGDRELLEHPVVVSIAEEMGKTVAQVLLRWGIQHGVIVIPCSTSKAHIEANMRVMDFSLTVGQMGRLDALDKGKRFAWKGVSFCFCFV